MEEKKHNRLDKYKRIKYKDPLKAKIADWYYERELDPFILRTTDALSMPLIDVAQQNLIMGIKLSFAEAIFQILYFIFFLNEIFFPASYGRGSPTFLILVAYVLPVNIIRYAIAYVISGFNWEKAKRMVNSVSEVSFGISFIPAFGIWNGFFGLIKLGLDLFVRLFIQCDSFFGDINRKRMSMWGCRSMYEENFGKVVHWHTNYTIEEPKKKQRLKKIKQQA